VMDCGDAGHILLSRHVAEDLEQYDHWQPCLHDLAECEVKHGVRVHLFNLYTDVVGNSELPEKFKSSPPAAIPPARKNRRTLLLLAVNPTITAALQKLLSIPYEGALANGNAPLTPGLLRLDRMFDPLRNDARFQKLCEEKQQKDGE